MATNSVLDRFDELLAGATNDEAVELMYLLAEDIAERASNVARLAAETDDRDAVNEAYAFCVTADAIIPHRFTGGHERLSDAWTRTLKAKERLTHLIAARGRVAPIVARKPTQPTAATRRVETRQADDLLASVDLSTDAVLAALARAAENGPARARDVTLELCPAATDTRTPGRQSLISRVARTIRALEAVGAVHRCAPTAGSSSYRWEITSTTTVEPAPAEGRV